MGVIRNNVMLILLLIFSGVVSVIISINVAEIYAQNNTLFLMLLFLSTAYIPQIYKSITRKFDFFSIDFLFVTAFTLYSLTEPLRIQLGYSDPNNQVITTILIEWTALVSFYIGYFAKLNGFKFYDKEFEILKVHKFAATIIFVVGAALFAVYFLKVGGFSGISKAQISLNKRDASWVSSFAFGWKFMNVGVLVWLTYYYKNTLKPVFLTKRMVILLFIMFTVSMMLGERGEILNLIFSIIIIKHFRQKKIKTKTAFAAGIFGYFSLQTLGHLKGSNPIEMITLFFGNVKWEWYSNFSGEFQSAARNLFVLVEYVPNHFRYMYGSTYLSTITNFIPASIWPDRPQNAVSWFNNTFYYNIVQNGQGRGFSLVGEAFLNFGVIGVVVVFVTLGFICSFLYAKVKNGQSDFYIIAYASLIPIMIYAIRADMSNLVGQFAKGTLVPFIFIVFLKALNDKLTKRDNNFK